jgi:ribosomal protein S12 methylthiotransferase
MKRGDLPKPRFHIVSLGCAKNTVDSHSMAALLRQSGMMQTSKLREADYVVVNTCGFIAPASSESMETLRELAANKRPGQHLIAAGCLSQRMGRELALQVPGVDAVLGTRRWMDILRLVQALQERRPPAPFMLPIGSSPIAPGTRRVAIQGASAYLQIADGCSRPCAFCTIPLIKGPAVSRRMEEILGDAAWLQEQGVREIILIAQDTTSYGRDLGMKDGLASLLQMLPAVAPQVDWFRILYAYPGSVSEKLIACMAQHPQVVHYIDMPLQHAHPSILKSMRRPWRMHSVRRTIAEMRQAMPDLALRTTFIVGYPGETEREFQELLDFVVEMRFDRLGVFPYFCERGTEAEALGDPISSEVKEERRQRLMQVQEQISLEKGKSFIGRTLAVLVEGRSEELSIGRSYRDAPEIDGLVIIDGPLEIGALVGVEITGALAHDLTARPLVAQDREA